MGDEAVCKQVVKKSICLVKGGTWNKGGDISDDGHNDVFSMAFTAAGFVVSLLHPLCFELTVSKDAIVFAPHQVIAFTSARAIESLSMISHNLDLRTPVVVLGESTASSAVAFGFTNVTLPPKVVNAYSLGRHIISIPDVSAVAFPCAESRRPDLELLLDKNGIHVQAVTLYRSRAVVCELPKLLYGQSTWVVLFSPSGTESFLKSSLLKSPHTKHFRYAAIGQTTAKFAISNGIPIEVVSPEPCPTALIEALNIDIQR